MRNRKFKNMLGGGVSPFGSSDGRDRKRSGINRLLTAIVALVATVALAVPTAYAVTGDTVVAGDSAQQDSADGAQGDVTGAEGDTVGDADVDGANGSDSADGASDSQADGSSGGEGTSGNDGVADDDAADGKSGEQDGSSDGEGDGQDADGSDMDKSQVPQVMSEASARADGEGTGLLEEDFTGSSVSSEVKFFGTACLTAATSGDYFCGTTKYPNGLTNGVQKYQGRSNGYLQLTDDSNSDSKGSQTGTVLYDHAIQSRLGLDIEFDTWQFSTENINDDGDGIGFFLTDGNYSLDEQGPMGSNFGGALGYSAIKGGGDGDDGNTQPGIAHGVLGVGLDVYGNYSSSKDVGGSDTRVWETDLHPNSVSVRGAGEQDERGAWTKGYGLLDGRIDATTGSGRYKTSMLTTDEPGVSRSVGTENTPAHVRIQLSALEEGVTEQTLTVTITKGDSEKTKTWTLTEPLPTLVKFGFSASTGQNSSAHFIRNVKVNTQKVAESDILMTKTVLREDVTIGGTLYTHTDKSVFSADDEVPYLFTVQNVGDTQLTDVTVNDPNIADVACQATVLDPNEQTICAGTLVLTDEQTKEGSFTNTATAIAQSEGGEVKNTDSETITTIPSLGAPDHSKRIRYNNDGTYTLALDATAKESSVSIPGSSKPLDIVLVLDESTSMSSNIGGGSSGSRLQALKIAANNFIDATVEENNSIEDEDLQHRLSIVTFSNNADTEIGLTAVNNSNASNLHSVVNGLRANGDTYPNEGFDEAGSVLRGARDNAQKVVIFFTDGVPAGPGTNVFDPEIAADAINSAHSLKNNGALVYSVGLLNGANANDTRSDFNKYMNAVSSNYPDATATFEEGDWWNPWDDDEYNVNLGTGSNQGYYKTPSTAEDLNKVFQEILDETTVSSAYEELWITDQLSEYAELSDTIACDENAEPNSSMPGFCRVSGDSSDGIGVWSRQADEDLFGKKLASGSYELWWNESTQTIRVKLLKPEAGKTYTLTLEIQPTDKAYEDYAAHGYRYDSNGNQQIDENDSERKGDKGSDLPGNNTSYGQAGFLSNDDAYVSYKTTGSESMEHEDYQQHPVIQVKGGSLSVSKTWSDGNDSHANGSVTVSLWKDGADTGRDLTLGPDNWNGMFEHLGPGRYTVVEESVAGYTPSYVYTKDGGQDADSPDAATIEVEDLYGTQSHTWSVTVTNTLNEYEYSTGNHLHLSKVLSNGTLQKGQFDFTLRVESASPNDGMTVKDMNGAEVQPGDDGIVTYTVSNGNNPNGHPNEVGAFDFGDIVFTKPGTYVVSVREVDESADHPDISYDGHVLYVRYVIGKDMTMTRYVASSDEMPDPGSDDDWTPVDEDFTDVNSWLTWTNTLVATNLPLTGGDATALNVVLAGGGVLLLAGAAWLLARRRRV